MFPKNPSTPRISLVGFLGSSISFRSSVASLVAQLKKSCPGGFTLDFSGVEFITRSATHQFLLEKKNFSEIGFVNQSDDIEKMFDIVRKTMYASAPPVIQHQYTFIRRPEQLPPDFF
jgi:hypothetical protein